MGRGRQKAKQTKVARKLKYFSPDTDLSALQRELATNRGSSDDLYSRYASEEPEDGDDSADDPYSKYADLDEDDDEDESADTWSHGSAHH